MKQYVLMSNEELGELEHFGVRGMKWGVRKNPITRGIRRAVGWGTITSGARAARAAAGGAKRAWVNSAGARKSAMRAGKRGLRNAKRYGKKGLRTAERYGSKGLRKVAKKWNGLSPAKKTAIVGTAATALLAAAAYSGGSAITMRGLEKAFNSNETFIEKNMRAGIADFNRRMMR